MNIIKHFFRYYLNLYYNLADISKIKLNRKLQINETFKACKLEVLIRSVKKTMIDENQDQFWEFQTLKHLISFSEQNVFLRNVI